MNYTSPIQPESDDKHKESSNKAPAKGGSKIVKIIAIVAGVIIVFVAGIIMLVFSMLSGVTGASGKFMDALKSGDAAAAYEMSAAGFKEQGTSEQFEVFVDNNEALAEMDSYTLNSFKMENNYGSARGTITSKGGTVSPVLVELVNENGEWKVININLDPPAEVSDNDDFDTSSTEFMDI